MNNKRSILTGEELSVEECWALLTLAEALKNERLRYVSKLAHKHLALLFEKPSFRTRLSFTVAMRELGGDVVESVSASRKSEAPEDQVRVVQGYCHAAMVRTFDDSVLERMSAVSTIPVINGLSDLHHPCQIMADLLTLQQYFDDINGLHLAYIGDGNNILHSLLLIAPQLGVNIHYCCPEAYGPNVQVLERAQRRKHPGTIQVFQDPSLAVKHCQAVYTDVWESMGHDARDEEAFRGFQVNEQLMAQADNAAIFLHCMPMERGKEVSATLPDTACSAVFQQSENRLHVQKALLLSLLDR